MKIKTLLSLIALLTTFYGHLSGQKAGLVINKCHLPCDSTVTMKVSLSDIQSWADSVPLTVICDDGNTYKIHQYGFSVLYKNPMQIKEFGIGNDGIPILARKAINGLKKDDTILLKEIVAIDVNGVEIKLPTISFKVKE
jgi:hypothetical protein